jgi:hypothetical protein
VGRRGPARVETLSTLSRPALRALSDRSGSARGTQCCRPPW